MTAFLIAALRWWADPSCQPLCLGKCHYDFAQMYCADTRVARLGHWDVQGPDYEPSKESDYGPLWRIPYPREFGYYPTEQRPSPLRPVMRSHGETYE